MAIDGSRWSYPQGEVLVALDGHKPAPEGLSSSYAFTLVSMPWEALTAYINSPIEI